MADKGLIRQHGLVVKDMGTASFYRGRTAQALLARFRERAAAPEVEYLDRDLSPREMAGLYAACDCLAYPYRGEGFGLPIAEAMLCALPVVVTGYGAALDFCDESRAYLVPARVVRQAEPRRRKRTGGPRWTSAPTSCPPGWAWRNRPSAAATPPRWKPSLANLRSYPAGWWRLPCCRRGHLARRDFASAKSLLVETMARFPQALQPAVVFSHVLLQEGRGRDGAEVALRTVLELDPGNSEARHNLEVLRRTQAAGAAA
jgi:hypothetical protein